MISEQTAARLRHIRQAGLYRLREIAREKGWPWERDLRVLKSIAHGSLEQAAEKNRLGCTSVKYILARYDEQAQTIIEEKRRKAN